jgi:VIT1/CCC1 family predicted Fe2+/Mn2+ transporter
MEIKMIDNETKRLLIRFQRNEITEHFVYKDLSRLEKGKNKEVLEHISNDELRHYNLWKKYTQRDIKPNKLKIFKYILLAKILGITFAIKLMESGEGKAQNAYKKITSKIPETKRVLIDEHEHERRLINVIDEERLNYIGSMILGLNDALVEFTGTIAGLTFALQNTKLVGISALITGIAASLSMTVTEYLSKKSDSHGKNPLRAAFYTGIAYILTVATLVFPQYILKNYYIALGLTLFDAVLVILLFTYFISVTKESSFRKGFFEMFCLSMGVASVSFLIGLMLRSVLNIDI